MINWFEVEAEQKIAQERYRVITDPAHKELATDSSPPQARQVLAWIGRRLTGLGCTLQALAGNACA